jgi:hypothetical protein
MNHRPGYELPTVPIGFNDLAALRSILSGSLAVLRRSAAQSPQRQTHMRLLEGVYQRLTGIPAQAVEARIFLSVPEVEVSDALLFCLEEYIEKPVGSYPDEDKHKAPTSTFPRPLSLQDAGPQASPSFPHWVVKLHQSIPE